jgi:hypothetical protein
MTEKPPEPDSRHELFEAARRSADWTLDELWYHYVALGGTLVIFDLEAYLFGLVPMEPGQQDVLACALNERLKDLFEAARVPYLTELANLKSHEDALEVLVNQLGDHS